MSKKNNFLILALLIASLTANSQPNGPDNDTRQIYTGVGGRDKAWYAYLASVGAIDGILDRSGFRYDIFLGYGKYKYNDSRATNHNGIISSVNLGIGYEAVIENNRFFLSVGPYYRSNKVSPADSVNNSTGSKIGYYIASDTNFWISREYTFEFNLSYGSIVDEIWTRARPGYTFDSSRVKIGPECSFEKQRNFKELRLGGFLALGHFRNAEVCFNAGHASYKFKSNTLSSPRKKGAYAGLNYSYRF
ncbi:MAG: cellulose biosynthesis protein BcsS [Proteobacteria bacterium]|nr:cellulose biosynthesis protein BcsS [Pseudomonadota bacterium]